MDLTGIGVRSDARVRPEIGRSNMRAPDFTLIDQSGHPWTLYEHLDTARMIVFLRGDW